MKLIMLNHPCYGIDVWETDDPAEIDIAERQGYIRESVLMAAPKMLQVLSGKVPSFAKDLDFMATSLEILGQAEMAKYLRRKSDEIRQVIAEAGDEENWSDNTVDLQKKAEDEE